MRKILSLFLGLAALAQVAADPAAENAIAEKFNNGDMNAVIAYSSRSDLSPMALYYIGVAYFNKDKDVDAILFLNRAIAADATVANFYYARALPEYFQQRLGQALADITEAISLQPDNGRYHHLLGDIVRQQGDLKIAIASYKTAVNLAPADGRIYLSLTDALLAAKSPETVSYLNQALTKATLKPEEKKLLQDRLALAKQQGL